MNNAATTDTPPTRDQARKRRPRSSTSLREIRRDQGLTTRQMAARVGVHPATISRLERGWVGNVRLETAAKVAAAYGVDLETLMQNTAQGDN